MLGWWGGRGGLDGGDGGNVGRTWWAALEVSRINCSLEVQSTPDVEDVCHINLPHSQPTVTLSDVIFEYPRRSRERFP